MLSGHVFRRQMWAPAIGVIGGGALRTPTVGMVNQDRSQDPQYMSKLLAKGQTVTLAAQMKSAEMIPTPTASDAIRGNTPETQMAHMHRKGRTGSQMHWPLSVMAQTLPTPRSHRVMAARLEAQQTDRRRNRGKGPNLEEAIAWSFLPTPTTNDSKNASLPPSQAERDGLAGAMLRDDSIPTGAATYLNPSFVEEMMGFPVGWTV